MSESSRNVWQRLIGPALAILVVTLLAAPPVLATSVIPISDQELYARAEVIVHGIVLSTDVTVDETGRPEMLTIISPIAVLKGHLPGSLVLHQLGGTLPDGRFLKIWGQPDYIPGQEVVVFAVARPPFEYQTAELLLGKFDVQQDARGTLFAVPALSIGVHPGVMVLDSPRTRRGEGSNEEATPSIERAPRQSGGPRALSDFLRFLRSGATGIEPAPARAEGSLHPVMHSDVAGPRLRPEWGNISDQFWRWNNGATATWTLVNTANITGGGTAEAINALAAWTNEPNSNINYTAGSGSSNTIDLNATSVCGTSGCLSGGGVIGCGGPSGGGSNSWRGDTYNTITGGFMQLRSYCTFNEYDTITTQAVIEHELGHTLGLGHSDQNVSAHDVCRGDEDAAIMRSYVQYRTTLGTDDQDAIRWIYGDGGNSCSAAPLTITALTPSPAPPQPTGTMITWTVTTSGGIAPLQYQFLRYSAATAAWTVVQPFSTSNNYSWTPGPSEGGSYVIEVWVKNAGSSASWDAYKTGPYFTITSSALAVTALTPSPAPPQPAGTKITWTVSTSGGTAPLQYQFLRYNVTTAAWTLVQPYSTSNTYAWTPGPAEAGSYVLEVWVKNAGSSKSWDAYLTGPRFTITSGSALAVTALTPSPTPPQATGTKITWTVTTSGGTAPLQYQFLRYSTTAAMWTVVQPYSTSNTFAWTPGPTEAGSYVIEVWVKNAGSSASWDTYKTGPYFTITP